MEDTALVIVSVILGLSALWFFFIAYRQHREKGMIFTNAWIWASKIERAQMDYRKKKLEYRLARNVFFLLGVLFLVLTLAIALSISWLFIVVNVLTAIFIVYAVVQWVLNERIYKVLGIK